jgi:hypothetical protein
LQVLHQDSLASFLLGSSWLAIGQWFTGSMRMPGHGVPQHDLSIACDLSPDDGRRTLLVRGLFPRGSFQRQSAGPLQLIAALEQVLTGEGNPRETASSPPRRFTDQDGPGVFMGTQVESQIVAADPGCARLIEFLIGISPRIEDTSGGGLSQQSDEHVDPVIKIRPIHGSPVSCKKHCLPI